MQRKLSGNALKRRTELNRGASWPRRAASHDTLARSCGSTTSIASTACTTSSSASMASSQPAPRVGSAVACCRSLYTRQSSDLHVLEGWSGIVTKSDAGGDLLVTWHGEGPRWVKRKHARHIQVMVHGAADDLPPTRCTSCGSASNPLEGENSIYSESSCQSGRRSSVASTETLSQPLKGILKPTRSLQEDEPARGGCWLTASLRRCVLGEAGASEVPPAPWTSWPATSGVAEQGLPYRGRQLEKSLGIPNVFGKM